MTISKQSGTLYPNSEIQKCARQRFKTEFVAALQFKLGKISQTFLSNDKHMSIFIERNATRKSKRPIR